MKLYERYILNHGRSSQMILGTVKNNYLSIIVLFDIQLLNVKQSVTLLPFHKRSSFEYSFLMIPIDSEEEPTSLGCTNYNIGMRRTLEYSWRSPMRPRYSDKPSLSFHVRFKQPNAHEIWEYSCRPQVFIQNLNLNITWRIFNLTKRGDFHEMKSEPTAIMQFPWTVALTQFLSMIEKIDFHFLWLLS